MSIVCPEYGKSFTSAPPDESLYKKYVLSGHVSPSGKFTFITDIAEHPVSDAQFPYEMPAHDGVPKHPAPYTPEQFPV